MKLLTICVLSAVAVLPLPAAEEAPPSPEVAWRTLALRAQAQLRQSQFAEAAENGKQALQIAKRFGKADPRVSTSHYLLGSIYRDWGRCTESRTNFAQAIALGRQRVKPNPRFVFNSITSLIITLCECEDFARGEKIYHDYKDELNRNRTDDMDEAKLLSMQAVLARGRRNNNKAEALFRQSLELMERTPDATPTELAAERSNLAVVLYQQGRHKESLELTEKVIAFFEKASPHHHSMLAALNNAACALAGLGRKDESERVFERAMALAQELYGEDNRTSARIMLNYARILRENNETPAAAEWQQRGAEAFHRSLTRDRATVDVEELRPRK